MPLSLTVSCSSKSRLVFTFLVLAHPGSPGQRAVERVLLMLLLLSINVFYRAGIRGHNLSTTVEQVVMVWACAVKRR